MVNYNPNLPDIAGDEWVPVVPSPYTMDTGVERGYDFTTTSSTTPFQGQYYLQAEPPASVLTQTPLIALYPKGQTDSVGEIRTVVIPVDGAVLAGNGVVFGPAGTTATTALQLSSDAAGIGLSSGVAAGSLTVSFDTITAVASSLGGKRILNVSLLYTAGGEWAKAGIGTTSLVTTGILFGGDLTLYGTGVLDSDQTFFRETITTVSRISLGEMNINTPVRYRDNTQAYPWRSNEMINWDAAAAAPMRFQVNWNNLPSASIGLTINYLAMEVTYCEETRIVYGANKLGSAYNAFAPLVANVYAVPGVNYAILRTASALATGSSLAAGDYTITSCMGDLGDMSFNFFGAVGFASSSVPPTAQACRQLYAMPHSTFNGVKVDRAVTVNERIDTAQSDVLPYIAFNVAFGALSDASTHAYGQQHTAPVYTGHNVKQNFNFTAVNANPYPYLRYYARRFGNCRAPLVATLTSNAAEFATLTCAAFDALPEIADGWKEITLTMAAPATLAVGADSLVWSSAASPAGSQWEILAAHGQADNLTSNFQNFSQFLEDPTGTSFFQDDATFYFMQQPPTPTGLAAIPSASALTGIGLDCGSPAECIPSGSPISIVFWTPITTSSPASSGTFGAYELERQDDADATWQLIGRFADIGHTSMFDVEPRFGMASRYRVRVRNIYNVPGPYSATASVTVPAVDASLWCFTSNHLNTNTFMAPSIGDQPPDFEPTFPEGDAVTLQEMYNRDYVVGFHGTERGGERFPLMLLANQGAVALPKFDNVFTNFRDLAWASIPYVCVRSGEGDRWYANVQVPNGNIRSRRVARKTQVVSVRVIETMNDPTPLEG